MYKNDTIFCQYCDLNAANEKDEARLWTCGDCRTPDGADAEYFDHWDAERAFRESVAALHDGW